MAYQNVTPDKFYGRAVVFRPERCLDDKVNLNVNPYGVNSKKDFLPVHSEDDFGYNRNFKLFHFHGTHKE